jgi:hypothetical protein
MENFTREYFQTFMEYQREVHDRAQNVRNIFLQILKNYGAYVKYDSQEFSAHYACDIVEIDFGRVNFRGTEWIPRGGGSEEHEWGFSTDLLFMTNDEVWKYFIDQFEQIKTKFLLQKTNESAKIEQSERETLARLKQKYEVSNALY